MPDDSAAYHSGSREGFEFRPHHPVIFPIRDGRAEVFIVPDPFMKTRAGFRKTIRRCDCERDLRYYWKKNTDDSQREKHPAQVEKNFAFYIIREFDHRFRYRDYRRRES